MISARTRLAGALGTAALAVAGCGGSQPLPPSQQYRGHGFTCCAELGSATQWESGQDVSLHWRAGPDQAQTSPNALPVTLSLVLSGPYAMVDQLKRSADARAILQITIATDSRSPAPEMLLHLPSDLPPGFYNLKQTNDWGGGTRSSGGTVVRIG